MFLFVDGDCTLAFQLHFPVSVFESTVYMLRSVLSFDFIIGSSVVSVPLLGLESIPSVFNPICRSRS